MPLLRSFRLAKLTQVLSLALLSCALAVPAAQAAPKKDAKKPVAAAPASAKKAAKEPAGKARAAAEPKAKGAKVAKGKQDKAEAKVAGKKGSKAAVVAKAEKPEKASGKKRSGGSSSRCNVCRASSPVLWPDGRSAFGV